MENLCSVAALARYIDSVTGRGRSLPAGAQTALRLAKDPEPGKEAVEECATHMRFAEHERCVLWPSPRPLGCPWSVGETSWL